MSSPNDERAERRDSRRRTILATVSLLSTVAVVGFIWTAWPTGPRTVASSVATDQPAASSPTPTTSSSSKTPAPSATPSEVPAAGTLPPAEATTQVSEFFAAAAALEPDATDTAEKLSKVASGAIIAEIENDQQELVANGWSQTGTPVVVSLKIVSADASATPPTSVAEACIDSSAVVTLDLDGKPLASAGGDHSQRALNIFTLQHDGSSWRVIARTFPDDANC